MRFRRYHKLVPVRGVTPQRLALARRAIERERERAGLLADLQEWPTPEERVLAMDAENIRQQHESRRLRAQGWRRARRELRALPEDERRGVLERWNNAMVPADPEYLLDWLTQHERSKRRGNPKAVT